MISGFEEQTEPLTDYEQETLLPLILQGLRLKVGAGNAVTNKAICAGMKSRGCKVSEARIRKIINHVRTHNLLPCLIATSKGYYITESAEELRQYIDSLKSRESAIAQVRHSMEGWLSQQLQQL